MPPTPPTAPAVDRLCEGARASRSYVLSPAIVEQFVEAYQDANPLHIDDAFARAHGFSQRVAHGAILNGFVSHFVWHAFAGLTPGGCLILHSVNIQYKTPCHAGDTIRIDGTVAQIAESVGTVTLDLLLTNVTRDRVAAKSKVQAGFL